MLRLSPLALLLLAACVTPEDGPVDPSRVGLQQPPDTCGAHRYSNLLGRHFREAPPQDALPNYRLAPHDAVLTADHRPERLNIFYEERSGRIVGIRCF